MRKIFLISLLCMLCGAVHAQKIKIKTGIEVLKEQKFKCLEGKRVGLITNPTGGPLYEYQLYFKDPDVGDVVHHTVTVRAWDDEGNSAFRSYDFDYLFVDTGGEIGTAYIYLDATTVRLGV